MDPWGRADVALSESPNSPDARDLFCVLGSEVEGTHSHRKTVLQPVKTNHPLTSLSLVVFWLKK